VLAIFFARFSAGGGERIPSVTLQRGGLQHIWCGHGSIIAGPNPLLWYQYIAPFRNEGGSESTPPCKIGEGLGDFFYGLE